MKKCRFLVLACVLLLAVILVAIPTTATAAVGAAKWSVPVYQGLDNYYGVNVVAFTAGSTANVTVPVTNDQAFDVTIREAKMTMDWGGAPIDGTFPATLKPGETAAFSFAVPIPSTASSQVLHSYQVKVGYQLQNNSYVQHVQSHWDAGPGNGVNLQFQTNFFPVVASSVKVYWQTAGPPASVVLQDPSSYTLNAYTGRITFGAAPPVGTEVFVDYQYFESLGAGTGTQAVYYTVSKPVVNGTLQVFVATPATGDFQAAAGWTADYETGKITMASAPTAFQQVFATYESWTRWAVVTGNNLAVYGTDQAAAMTAFQEYTALNANAPAFWVPLSTAGATARSNASVLAAQANARYAAGDFAAAASLYQQAVDQLEAAYAANHNLSNDAEAAVKALVQNAAPVIKAYGNKLDGEAEAAKGQASMYKNVGVFSILLGVATLLAGIGGILWAYSRLVEARGPKHD